METPWRKPQVKLEPPTRAEFDAARKLGAGRTNPELTDVPFWTYMVRSGDDPYGMRKHFDIDAMQKPPVWTFRRMGMPSIVYEDRLMISIGGEHEDFYDPDFRIYNDVVIRDFNG